MNQLTIEIIDIIFVEFKDDISSLNKLLFVNRTFFILAVKYLYRSVLYFKRNILLQRQRNKEDFDNSLFGIIINCLPEKLKLKDSFKYDYKFNDLMINYLDFCKNVSVHETILLIHKINQSNILKEALIKHLFNTSNMRKISIRVKFGFLPINEFFSRDIVSITIVINDKTISNDILKIINCQRRLLSLKLINSMNIWNKFIKKLPKILTLKKLCISDFMPDCFLFINELFPNIVEFKLENIVFNKHTFYCLDSIKVNFLRNLKIGFFIQGCDIFNNKLQEFIKNNGNYLECIHIHIKENDYIPLIFEYCKNIKSLCIQVFDFKKIINSSIGIKNILSESKNLSRIEIIISNFDASDMAILQLVETFGNYYIISKKNKNIIEISFYNENISMKSIIDYKFVNFYNKKITIMSVSENVLYDEDGHCDLSISEDEVEND